MALSSRQLAALLFVDRGASAGRCQCRLCGKLFTRSLDALLAHLRGAHPDSEQRALEAFQRRRERHQRRMSDAEDGQETPVAAEAHEAQASDVASDVEEHNDDQQGPSDEPKPSDEDKPAGTVEDGDTAETAVATPPSKLGKRRRDSDADSAATAAAADADDSIVALSPPDKLRKMANNHAALPATLQEVYALHAARKMELAHKKLRAEMALQERRLNLEAAKERNRNVLELVRLGKTPEEIEKLMPLFS